MATEDAAFIDDMEETPIQQQTPEQLAAVRAEFDVDLRKDTAYKPAADLWDNGFESDVENESDRIAFESMDAGSRLEWMAHATDYNDGNIDLDALGQEYDFIRADFIKDTENAQREITDQNRQTESQADPQETDPAGREVREEGTRLEQSEERADGGQNLEQLTAAEQNERASKVKVVTKKKRRVVKPPKNPEEAPEAKRQGKDSELNAVDAVDAVAEKLGGEVVYQKGEVALVRGYSAQSGAPVYAAAKGSMFTKVDVDSYTGTEFTPEQIADLVEAKKAAEAEAQKVHTETPFITFSNGLAFSESMTPEMQGVVREWQI